jgi:hypothetical protein
MIIITQIRKTSGFEQECDPFALASDVSFRLISEPALRYPHVKLQQVGIFELWYIGDM